MPSCYRRDDWPSRSDLLSKAMKFVPARDGSTDRVIVNVGVGNHYESGHRSTFNHCLANCPEAALMFWDDYPDGCPPQHESMYAFKIFAIREAIKAGFRYILWMDTAFQPVRSIAPLWETVEREGWYVPPQGDSKLGHWCSDAALTAYGIGRETASCIPLCFSGLVGLDMESKMGKQIWWGWEKFYKLGTFNGPHRNIPGGDWAAWGQKWQGHCSDDPRVQGHRHDESALAF